MTELHALNVLLADDNPHMRTIIATMLRSFSINQVRETIDGASALEALKQAPADLAIVDFKMLPMNGVQFTQVVRTSANSPDPYLPIILMTGHSERRRVFEARDAGVTEILAKPVTAQSLMARIENVILHPRAFIRTDSFFGPDRRRTHLVDFNGPYRRSTDPKAS